MLSFMKYFVPKHCPHCPLNAIVETNSESHMKCDISQIPHYTKADLSLQSALDLPPLSTPKYMSGFLSVPLPITTTGQRPEPVLHLFPGKQNQLLIYCPLHSSVAHPLIYFPHHCHLPCLFNHA